ncbi:hypothetical protein LR48_Vigan07g118500 [Vigna angularis]|uniref:Uncharacterized protein n=1 Tax=Phaseolus angularis TaxID=3914 RepID=A0A0L9UXQ1_PHAAN|nr:hypothetical protein LR48_Vigan07g118500 [Vigna angularis]
MSASDSGSGKSRRGRGVTRVADVTSGRVDGQRRHVDIAPRSGHPLGPNADRFRSYLGKLAKSHVSILHACWDDVPEVDKNLLWQDVLTSVSVQSDVYRRPSVHIRTSHPSATPKKLSEDDVRLQTAADVYMDVRPQTADVYNKRPCSGRTSEGRLPHRRPAYAGRQKAKISDVKSRFCTSVGSGSAEGQPKPLLRHYRSAALTESVLLLSLT